MLDYIIPLVTCVNLDDYLRVSLSRNRCFFKEFYILTSDTDESTKKLCETFNVNAIEYENFFNKEYEVEYSSIFNKKVIKKTANMTTIFNKSGGIRYAQEILHRMYPDKWILILDVDIVITKEVIEELKNKQLDTNYLYGINRYDVLTMDDLNNEIKTMPYTTPYSGYFQLYYNKDIYYPEISHNASICDIFFRDNFDKKELINHHVFHLGRAGSHWNGRGIALFFTENQS